MLYMRGSSTNDSFTRNRLTYKRAKCCERTGRKSQYFTLISVISCHCVCLVTPTSRTSALCIIMAPVPTGELAVYCLWMLLQLPLPLSGCLEEKHPPRLKGFWRCLQTSHTHTHTHRRQSIFRCDGWDVALVCRGGGAHKTHVHYICRYTKQSQRILSLDAF